MVYSYTYQWFYPRRRRWRVLLNGLVFGGIAIVLTGEPIQPSSGLFSDASAVPVALIGLFEGWVAGLVGGGIGATYRATVGDGTLLEALDLVAAGAAGGLVHVWARREGGVGPKHAFALAGLVFVATLGTFWLAGSGALALKSDAWLSLVAIDGIGIGFVAQLFTDVRRRARLITAQDRFRAIIDEASEAIRIVDADTRRIVEANRMDCQISGYSREELIGRDARDVWPKAADDGTARDRGRADDVARAFDVPYPTRSGATVLVDATRRVVEHEGRRYEIVIYREAADRRAMHVAQREVAELRALRLLAGAAAHEINNPLAVVVGSLALLGRRQTSEVEETRWLEQATAACERIRGIVERMNRITRIESTPARGGLPPMLDIEKSTGNP